MSLSSQEVQAAARILAEYNLGEIEIESTDDAAPFRLRLVRELPRAPRESAAPETATPERGETELQIASPAVASPSLIEVHATAVGLFRAAKTPVQTGEEVRRKQVLGAVESLKTPNDVLCPADGRIAEIHASEGQGVEYGQLLFSVEAA